MPLSTALANAQVRDLDETEKVLINFEIPSDPIVLSAFTKQAELLARAGRWASLTMLYEFKILPLLENKFKSQVFNSTDQVAIFDRLWEEIVLLFGNLRLDVDKEYDMFVNFIHKIIYGRLVKKYDQLIYSYIYRRTSDPELSEDLTGQTFLKMFEAIENTKSWNRHFSGWLYRIAHNLVIDHYRVRDRHKSISIDEVPFHVDQGQDPFRSAELSIDRDMLFHALMRLTDDQAQVIRLRFLEGYSFSEIAEVMDKTEGAVKALQHRAINALRVIMKDPD